jgi:L-lactate dehydrogenase complex protein LldG
MTKGTLHNREAFLNNVAKQLGRNRITAPVERPNWQHQPQWNVLKDKNQDELVEVLEKQCKNIHTNFVRSSKDRLGQVLQNTIQEYDGKLVVTWDDPRNEEYRLLKSLQANEELEVHCWNPKLGEENIKIAERADVGITFSDITLAESGTVVLFSDNGKGRSVSLLPTTYIAIIPKSTIVPRMSQATRKIHQLVEKGEIVASCVNFITGPSNSADIEMNLVVGVHGPIKVTYIVVEDA